MKSEVVPIARNAVLGAPLSGRGQLLRCLAAMNGPDLEKRSDSNMEMVTLRFRGAGNYPDLSLAKLGLAGSIFCRTFERAQRILPGVVDQKDFLAKADGIVFVIDGLEVRSGANISAWERWQGLAKEVERPIEKEATFFIVDKMDLPGILPASDWGHRLGVPLHRLTEVSALEGGGVDPVLTSLFKFFATSGPESSGATA